MQTKQTSNEGVGAGGGGPLSEVFKDKNFTGAMLNVLLYGCHIALIVIMILLWVPCLMYHFTATTFKQGP